MESTLQTTDEKDDHLEHLHEVARLLFEHA
jgi:hypothetical protein